MSLIRGVRLFSSLYFTYKFTVEDFTLKFYNPKYAYILGVFELASVS